MGCCPFHQEKTPSFSVNPSKGFYKCFGCGKGGSAFNFVMEIEGLNFPEAIKRVAEISGVPLPEPIDDEKYEKHKKRREEKKAIAEQVIELNNYALEFWENHLQDDNAHSKAAREYLEKREISKETQKAFRIGFAPDSWDALMSVLKEKGADDKLIETSGLVSVNEEKNKVYDRFRGRVMFPVLNLEGNPIAFGARILAQGEPKYLNSPETPAYVKGEHLYGLFQSKVEIRKKKYAILVEGYLDLIALYQYGITNTAASLGTAFTQEQAKLLGRFARRVVINYDGDSAGVKAARRAIETLLAEDFETKVLVLPDGQDPDDFLKANGAESYNHLRGNAAPYLQFVLENLAREKNLSSPKAKAEAVEDILPILSVIRNVIERRETLKQALRFFQIDDKVTEGYLWKEIQKREKDFAKRDGNNNENKPEEKRLELKNFVIKRNTTRPTVAEQQLLELLIYDRELREMILPALEETDYQQLATAEIFRALLALREIGTEITRESLLKMVEDDAAASDFVSLLLLSEPAREADEAIDAVLHEAENCVATLRGMAISRRILDISQELVFAEQTGDVPLRDQLVMEQIELARLKRELEKRIATTI
jgi:DNA primase